MARPPRAPSRPDGRHRRRRAAPGIALGVAALVVLGGLAGLGAAMVALAVLLAGASRPWLTRKVPVLAASAVVLAGLVVAVRPWPGPDPGAHSAVAQVLVLVGVAVAVIGSIPWQRPGAAPDAQDEEYVALSDMFGRRRVGLRVSALHRDGS